MLTNRIAVGKTTLLFALDELIRQGFSVNAIAEW